MTQRAARKKLSRDVREAACLLQIRKGDGWLIPEPLRSSGDAKAIIAYVQYDHATPHALTADDRPQNLAPMGRVDHAVKTTKTDVPQMAKTKRITAKQQAFRARLLAKGENFRDATKVLRMTAKTEVFRGATKNPAKPKAKIKSRGFAGSRKFDGTVVFKDRR